MTYKASSATDVNDLATMLENLDEFKTLEFVRLVLHKSLMKPPLWLGVMLALLKAIRGRHGINNFVTLLWNSKPEIIGDLFDQTIEHMLYGKDQEDVNSAGGFSQREIDLIVEHMQLD
jgi:hypothetical protein